MYHNLNRFVEGGDSLSFKDDQTYQGFKGQPLEVKVYNNLEKAIKVFKALVQKEKILSVYKEKSRYEKPSDKKRRKKNEAVRKQMELEYRSKYDGKGHRRDDDG